MVGVRLPLVDVPLTKSLRDQDLDRTPQQVVAGVAEDLLRHLVGEPDRPVVVDQEYGIRHGLQHLSSSGVYESKVRHAIVPRVRSGQTLSFGGGRSSVTMMRLP